MDFYWWSEDIAQVVLSAALILLPTLVIVAASLRGMTWVARDGKALWRMIRPALDEDTDALVLLIAKRTGKTPAWVRENLTAKLDEWANA